MSSIQVIRVWEWGGKCAGKKKFVGLSTKNFPNLIRQIHTFNHPNKPKQDKPKEKNTTTDKMLKTKITEKSLKTVTKY